MDKKDKPFKSIKKQNYLEIYIQDDGSLMLAPITKDNLTVFKAISGRPRQRPSLYCG
jgi:hypothetical protein